MNGPKPVIKNKVNQKVKNKYSTSMHICGIQKNATDEPILLGRIVDTDIEKGLVEQLAEGAFFSHLESLLQGLASQEIIQDILEYGYHTKAWKKCFSLDYF